MRYLVFFILFLPTVLSSQTFEIERKILRNQYETGKISSERYAVQGKKFVEFVDEIGGYPELPYNEEFGRFQFQFVQELSQPKAVSFRRIMEWAAFTFGSLDAVLHYKDFEAGKIILKGSFDVQFVEDYNFFFKKREGVNSRTCFFTLIFTIKNQKIKVEAINIEYEFLYAVLSNNAAYSNERRKITIDRLYPIIKWDEREWKGNLNLVKETNNSIRSFVKNVILYIESNDNDYSF